MRLAKLLSAAVLTSVLSAPALAATCNHPAGMDGFLAEFKKEAAAKGISRKGISALDGIAVDPTVLAADKRQGVFKQTFEEFSGRMISRDRMTKGLRHMHTHARDAQEGRAAASACPAPWWLRCGVSKPTTAPTSARRK